MEPKISTRIDMAIAYLKANRKIRFQKEVAERMGVDVNTVSRAKSGGNYNPESFAMRFNAAFDFIFSNEWLLKGEGDMLANKTKAPALPAHPSIIPGPSAPSISAATADATVTSEPATIPPWADSLIQLATDNTVAIQNLRSEIADLRATLIKITQMYNLAPEALPMAAENHKNK